MDTGLKVQIAQRQLVSLSASEGEFDVQAPVGFFDPLGLGKEGDVAVFKLRRSVVDALRACDHGLHRTKDCCQVPLEPCHPASA